VAKRGKKMLEVDSCIKAFLKDFRQFAHVGAQDEGAYYWNEREIQWELFRHLRQRAVSHRIGSEWWFHAEGTVEKPAYSRWRSRKRADVVIQPLQLQEMVSVANRQLAHIRADD
jgi:hypothetical protein